MSGVYEPLFVFNSVKAEQIPWLAVASEWREDNRVLRLTTRDGVRWSDGRPIRGADVRFTYDLLADTTLALPLSSVASRIDSISLPDDSTVVFHFDGAYTGMLFDTGVGILPEHFFADVPRERLRGGVPLPDGRGPSDLPVSGPFRLEQWQPDDRIVLERNDAAVQPARLERQEQHDQATEDDHFEMLGEIDRHRDPEPGRRVGQRDRQEHDEGGTQEAAQHAAETADDDHEQDLEG